MAVFVLHSVQPAMAPSISIINRVERPRRRAAIASVFVAAMLSCQPSGAFAQLYATPITDPEKLYLMDGYSIAPPSGKAWFEMKRDRNYVFFGKRLGSPTHSLIAVAASATMSDAIENVEAFREYVIRQYTADAADQRNKILVSAAEIDPATGPFCVRYQTRTEDRGAANAAGKTLLAETTGVSCLHPQQKTLAIDLSYTERGLPAETGASLRGEVEHFIHSLKFLPRP